MKRVLSFAKLPENERNRAGLSAKITGSVPVLCKDKESKRKPNKFELARAASYHVGKITKNLFLEWMPGDFADFWLLLQTISIDYAV